MLCLECCLSGGWSALFLARQHLATASQRTPRRKEKQCHNADLETGPAGTGRVTSVVEKLAPLFPRKWSGVAVPAAFFEHKRVILVCAARPADHLSIKRSISRFSRAPLLLHSLLFFSSSLSLSLCGFSVQSDLSKLVKTVL